MTPPVEFQKPKRIVILKWFCTKCGEFITEDDGCYPQCEYSGVPVMERPEGRVFTARLVLKNVVRGLGRPERR